MVSARAAVGKCDAKHYSVFGWRWKEEQIGWGKGLVKAPVRSYVPRGSLCSSLKHWSKRRSNTRPHHAAGAVCCGGGKLDRRILVSRYSGLRG